MTDKQILEKVDEAMKLGRKQTLEKMEQILEKYKLRIPPTVYYDLLADVRNCEVSDETN